MLLEVQNLRITKADGVELVRGVDFSIREGEWFSLIGESGSGKSITAFAVGNLLPRALTRGADRLSFLKTDLRGLPETQYRRIRGKSMSFVFQDYHGAFTPYYKLGPQMAEAARAHDSQAGSGARERIVTALWEVGLDGEEMYGRYPFQVSGGQLQRAALALAMLLQPALLIADEPTTALDAVSAALVLELIAKMKREKGCSVLFITHDLRIVRKYADNVSIMQAGAIVESGAKKDVLAAPRHVYTRDLLAAIPPLRGTPDRLPIRAAERTIA